MFSDIVITLHEPNYWLAAATVAVLMGVGLTLIYLGEKDEKNNKKSNNQE